MSGSETREILQQQLATLQRGRGIRRSDLGAATGSPLCDALGLTATMSEVDVVRRIYTSLKSVASGLPTDLQVAFLVACGIASDGRLLKDRLKEAGIHLDRTERTVQRRLAEANSLVAAMLLTRLEPMTDRAVKTWYVEAMGSTVRLDRERPEFVASRQIVATRRTPSINESISIPRPDRGDLAPAVEIEVLDGGQLASFERTSASSWSFEVDPGRVLEAGDRHHYTTLIRMPSASFIKPYAVMVPLQECLEFAVTVHFDPARIPRPVHRVDGLLPVALDDEPVGPELAVSTDGSAAAAFRHLSSGYAYGLRWASPVAEPVN